MTVQGGGRPPAPPFAPIEDTNRPSHLPKNPFSRPHTQQRKWAISMARVGPQVPDKLLLAVGETL